jgi:RimJ/RimL family protein N-acetyltransferase
MKAEIATEKDLVVFKKWRCSDRIEELTCRPVQNGLRVPRSDKFVVLSFFIDDFEEPAGKFTFFDMNERNRSCEVGYSVNPSLRGKGIGTKMLKTCINYLFNNLDLNKVYCQTASFNTASVKLLEGLGFHRDGILREHHELDGKLFDDHIYSILKSEWKII